MSKEEKQLLCSDIIREIKLCWYDKYYDETLLDSNRPKMIPFKEVLTIIAKYGDMIND